MKRLLIILSLIFCFVYSNGQSIVQRAGQANTVSDARWQALYNAFLPRYNDTTAANLQKGIDSCGAKIYTRNPQAEWTRFCNPHRWVRTGNGSGVVNIDSSITSITHLGDTALVVCFGSGVCDTIAITSSITNINNVGIISFTDSSINVQVCSIVAVTPDSSASVCDTVTISLGGNSSLVLQNGIGYFNRGIGELGDVDGQNLHPLLHDTRINTNARFLFMGNWVFTDNTFSRSGVLGGTVNWQQGSYNIGFQQPFKYVSSYPGLTGATGTDGGIGNIFTNDTLSGNVYPFPDSSGANGHKTILARWMNHNGVESDKFFVQGSGRIWSADYPYVANPDTILSVNGGFISSTLRSQVGGSIVNVINDTTINICSVIGATQSTACDTFVVNNVGAIQTVRISGDTLFVCGLTLCDTLVTSTTFSTAAMVIQNSLYVAKNGNDAQGIRNRLDKPFLTILGALSAAQTGDVIVVYPGTYEELHPINLQKSVNYHFIGKGELRLTTSVGSGAMFTDSNNISTSIIDAPGWTFRARNSQKVIEETAPSDIRIIADEIISNNGKTLNIIDSASVNVKANRLYANAFAGAIWIDSALSVYADIDVIETGVFGDAIWSSNTPKIDIHAKRIIADSTNDDYLIHIFDTNPTDSIYIDADEMRSGTEWAIWAKGASPAIFIHSKIISAKSDCVVTSSTDPTGTLTVESDVIQDKTTGAMDGVVNGEGGTILLKSARLIHNSASTGYDIATSIFGGDTGYVKMIAVSYDTTRVNPVPAGTITRIDRDFYSGISGNFNQTTSAPYVLVLGATPARDVLKIPFDSIHTTITADNGLTKNTSTNVQLGATASGANSPLLHTTYINNNGFDFVISGTGTPTYSLHAITTSNFAVYGEATSGFGVQGFATTGIAVGGSANGAAGVGVYGLSQLSYGVQGTSNGDVAGYFTRGASSTNSVLEVLRILRTSTGTAATGLGASIDFQLQNSFPSNVISNQLISKWTTATTGSQTSQFIITGVNSAVTADLFTLSGSGETKLNKYGAGSFISGTGTYLIATKSDGTLMEFPTGGLSTVAVSADNGLTDSSGRIIMGGGFYKNTQILSNGFTLTLTGSNAATTILQVTNSSAAAAVTGTSNSNSGVYGITQTGSGVYGESSGAGNGVFAYNSSTGIALNTQSKSNYAGQVYRLSTTSGEASSILATLNIQRNNGVGTIGNGSGQSVDFTTGTSTAALRVSNQFISKWTIATDASRSALFEVTGTTNAAIDTILKMGDYVTLTESSATLFAQTLVGTGKIGGGEIVVTIEANDATDFQTRTMRFVWTAVNKAGTTTITIGTPEEIAAVSSGTLTATITAVDGGSGIVQFKANAVSSLTQTTLRCSYQMSKNF